MIITKEEIRKDGKRAHPKFHTKDMCAGEFCVFHKPSKHKMLKWAMNMRIDAFAFPLIERLCPHGVGHPDPDSVAFMNAGRDGKGKTWGIHGCDGCCYEEVGE